MWCRLPHLTTYDITEIDTEVWAVLTEIGGGAEMTRKAMLLSHRYCGANAGESLGDALARKPTNA